MLCIRVTARDERFLETYVLYTPRLLSIDREKKRSYYNTSKMEHKAAQDNQYKAMMAEINDTLSSESDDSTEHEVTHIMTSISSSDQHLGRFAKSIRKAPQKTSTRQHSFSQRKDLPGSLGLRRSKSNKSSTVGFGEDSADDSKDHDDEAFDESSSDSEVDEYHHPGQQQHPDVMLLRESKEALERQHDADVFASLVSDDRESAPGDGSDRRSHQYFRHRHASTSKSSSSPHGRSSRSRSDARIRSSTPSSITSPLHTLGSVDISAMKHFIHTPHRKGERAIRCYVEREKGGGVSAFRPPTYRLFLEEGRQFIMAAKKRSKNKTSNYLISLEKHPRDDRHSSLVVGKVRSNWSGSEYVIFDAGLSPKKTVVKAHGRCILGLVGFRYDKMGPGKLAGCVPRVNEGGVPLTLVDEMVGSGLASKIWDQIDQGVDTEKLMVLRNKVRRTFEPWMCIGMIVKY